MHAFTVWDNAVFPVVLKALRMQSCCLIYCELQAISLNGWEWCVVPLRHMMRSLTPSGRPLPCWRMVQWLWQQGMPIQPTA